MFIDTHAHLTSKEFDADRDEVIARARDAGVTAIINPGTSLDDSRRAVELAAGHEGIYACVGVHPHEASHAGNEVLAAIEELCTGNKVVAIGEIGLDFHYDFAPRDVQERVFSAQLGIAARNNLPVVIHTRDAMEETLRIVRNALAVYPGWRSQAATELDRFPPPRGVFHCFPGDPALAWELVRLGFSVSLPGIVTFKNAGFAADVAREVSAEHLLLETDSPYLAPVPHRGTRNEPARLPVIAAKIAGLQHLSTDDIARTTSYGAYRMFGVGSPALPVFVYPLKNSLYINLTIRCNADCVFCDRKGAAVIKGHNLRIEREPEAREVIDAIGDPLKYDEIVFCGYGEPTIRLGALKEVAAWVKSRGERPASTRTVTGT